MAEIEGQNDQRFCFFFWSDRRRSKLAKGDRTFGGRIDFPRLASLTFVLVFPRASSD